MAIATGINEELEEHEEAKQLIARYKFDKSIYDNLIPEFSVEFINFEIVDEYLDTNDIVTTRTETMMLMSYDAEPDEYGVLTTESEIESLKTFSAENIITRSIYSSELPTFISFNNDGKSSLLEIDHLNINNITDMQYMFYSCDNLINVNSSDWDTSNITDMSYAFNTCVSLASIDVRNWRTSNVTATYAMFDSCSSLTSLDLSGWNTSNMINMNSMFSGSTSLTSLDLSNWVLNDADIGYMCSRCANLTTVKLNNWNFSKPNWLSGTFNSCTNLNLIYMKNSNVKSVNNIISLLPTRTTDSPGTIDIAGIDDINQLNTTAAESKFWNVTLEGYEEPVGNAICVYKFDNTLYDLIPEFNDGFTYTYKDIVEGNVTTRTIYSSNLPTMIQFGGSTKNDKTNSLLEVLYVNTSNLDNMQYILANCANLTMVNTNDWDTSKVTTMHSAFYGCSKLTTLDLSGWNTDNVTTIETMFAYCSSLSTIVSLNDLNVSNVYNMGGLFTDCPNLTEINVSDWDVSKVTNFGAIFRRCSKLTNIDISKWDTSSGVIMSGIFTNCSGLIEIDISNWDMSHANSVSQMFYGCSALTKLKMIANLNQEAVTTFWFSKCDSLVDVQLFNFDTYTINKVIDELPTRSANNQGSLIIPKIDDSINTVTADSKYWIVSPDPTNIRQIYLGDTVVSNLYIGEVGVKKVYLGEVLVYENKQAVDNVDILYNEFTSTLFVLKEDALTYIEEEPALNINNNIIRVEYDEENSNLNIGGDK